MNNSLNEKRLLLIKKYSLTEYSRYTTENKTQLYGNVLRAYRLRWVCIFGLREGVIVYAE